MKNIKQIVKDNYGKIAVQNSSCCSGNSCCDGGNLINLGKIIGYSESELNEVPNNANLGLGCGNPLALATLKLGETILDLGSGAGFDSFLASRKIGDTGRVIGVDITEEMVSKAKENAVKGKYTNVEFRLGDIEELPIKDSYIDAIISNCVINLAPNKGKVFKEAYRVLKSGGRMMVSDVVLLKKLPKKLQKDENLLAGCVSGAILKSDYLELLKKSGFTNIVIHKETPMFLNDYAVSISFTAIK